ncbi:PQQ-binding-like beta-propeller repeat protein [Mycolicibacterium farcinogenes]|uniref:PQQ-binding-like beta-propeller repeat protein n=1 Tax=Mycolicibacterium farcinogenes TaxID=1802 RepID=A0ACD1FEV4_MYCFR|nr:PQQ-binding-like beta-propeller repeat protein [Mycolicibacterium farcinogenes]QZH65614.1 PQQ-binding-like beta-propeller repeat protein [Mycolicibacterium farcinogenes]
MSDETSSADDAPSRLSLVLVLVAMSVGLGVGSAALSAYAFLMRVPDGLSSDRLGPVTGLLLGSLVAVIAVASLLILQAARVLAGMRIAVQIAWIATGIAAVTAWSHLSTVVTDRAKLISGPGSHPAIAAGQTSWLLLAMAATLLSAAAVAARRRETPVPWAVLGGATAVGLVVALVAGVTVMTLSGRSANATTAAAVATPETPTTIGTHVAYTVVDNSAEFVLPAGPGFVLPAGGAIVGHDGPTGSERWRFPVALFPTDCKLTYLKSTGIAENAVVLAECRRNTAFLDSGNNEYGTDPFLVGLDAMTGAVLWSLDRGWALKGPTLLPAGVAPVRRGDDIGVLDPRTGELRWQQPIDDDARCDPRETIYALPRAIAYAAKCGNADTMHVLDANTGAARTIDLTFVANQPTDLAFDAVAADGNVIVVRVDGFDDGADPLLAVHTDTGRVETILSDGGVRAYDVFSARDGQYPGPVLQLDARVRTDESVNLYRVAEGATIHAPGVNTSDRDTYTAQHWAQIGDQMVTAAAQDEEDHWTLVVVNPDGTSTSRPSPCGVDIGGLVPVPGAILLLCQRNSRTSGSVDEIHVLGMR